jgi:hypothetical protein
MELPHIVSRINGMKIALLPGQASILHRFEQPDNKLVVASTSYNALLDQRDDANDLVIPATQDPAEAPRAHVSQTKPRPQAQPVADTGALVQAQKVAEARAAAAEQELAALKAQLAAAKTAETKAPKAKAVKEANVPAFVPPAIPALEGAVS